jgi:hypothetical protein
VLVCQAARGAFSKKKGMRVTSESNGFDVSVRRDEPGMQNRILETQGPATFEDGQQAQGVQKGLKLSQGDVDCPTTDTKPSFPANHP